MVCHGSESRLQISAAGEIRGLHFGFILKFCLLFFYFKSSVNTVHRRLASLRCSFAKAASYVAEMLVLVEPPTEDQSGLRAATSPNISQVDVVFICVSSLQKKPFRPPVAAVAQQSSVLSQH